MLKHINSMQNIGKEWLLHALQPLSDIERSILLMLLWWAWHIRNEVVHYKPPPPMEASRRFLVSYLDSLVGIKIDLSLDVSKGKSFVTYDNPSNWSTAFTREMGPKWSAPKAGWVKLSSDGSYAKDGSAGAVMVLRDDKGEIIFSSCRQLFPCRDALEAELCACMEGLSTAMELATTDCMNFLS